MRGYRFSSNLYFGTQVSAILYAPSNASGRHRASRAWKAVQTFFGQVQQAASCTAPTSQLQAFNEAAPGGSIPVCGHLCHLLRIARATWELTDGFYDPTVGPLVDLWGFSAARRNTNGGHDPQTRPPSPQTIAAMRDLVGLERLRIENLDNDSLVLHKLDVYARANGSTYTQQLDLGGIAKGYAADGALEIFHAHGLTHGYLNCGGSEIVLLQNPRSPDGLWEVPIDDAGPDDQRYVYAKDTVVTTSSLSQHRYIVDGCTYSHIVDPHTGRATALDAGRPCWAVLVGTPAAVADGAATALCLDRGRIIDERLSGRFAIVRPTWARF